MDMIKKLTRLGGLAAGIGIATVIAFILLLAAFDYLFNVIAP